MVYTGSIYVDSNDPVDPRLIVSVEMAALADLTTGRLAGVIRSNRTGAPLADAQIQAQASGSDARLRTTDERGAYSFWLSPATYAVTVSATGYVTTQSNVLVPPQGLVTHDLTLVHDVPWLRLTPARVVAADDGAGPASLEVVVANAGSQPLSYALALDSLPAWVSIAPGDGLVAAGAAETIGVQVDASAAPPGWTVIAVPLASNDPWQSPAALRLYVRRGQAMMLPTMRFR